MGRLTVRPRPGASTDAAVAVALAEIASVLRAGGDVRDGLAVAAAHGPLAPALRATLAQIDAGVPVRQALVELRRRHPVAPVELAVAAMTLSLETGAAHARTLETVVEIIRSQAATEREIHALAAPARASALVIVLAPPVFLALVALLDARVLDGVVSAAGSGFLAAGVVCDLVGAWWMARLVRRATRPPSSSGVDELPELVDLLALALGAGCTVPGAIAEVAPYVAGRAGAIVRSTATRLAASAPLTDELAHWPEALGDDAHLLVSSLVSAHHDGAPVAHPLERLADELRRSQRQRVEAQVHRLPVALLFPLVLCVFPAFVLLTVLPITIGSLGALRGVS
jgi:Flp pilus assembly protein TadB